MLPVLATVVEKSMMAVLNRVNTTLSLGTALKFLDYGTGSRCFVDGLRVLAADPLILISIKDFTGETAEIVVR